MAGCDRCSYGILCIAKALVCRRRAFRFATLLVSWPALQLITTDSLRLVLRPVLSLQDLRQLEAQHEHIGRAFQARHGGSLTGGGPKYTSVKQHQWCHQLEPDQEVPADPR